MTISPSHSPAHASFGTQAAEHRTRGVGAFTLIEVLSVIVIVATLMTVSSKIIFASIDAYAVAATRARLTAEMSSAMERVSSALRDIPLDTTQTTAKPSIQSLSTGSITWSSTSSLSLSSGSLVLTTATDGSMTLLPDVTSLTLAAYNEAGTALSLPLSGAACQAVQRIDVTVATTRQGISETLRTRIFLRNLVETAAPS